jgi:hypothetical protein
MPRLLFVIFLVGFSGLKVFADDAAVLPQGKFRLRLVSSYTDIDSRYDSSSGVLSYGSNFSRSLDGRLMATLAQRSELTDAVKKMNAVIPGSGDALLSEEIASLKTDIQTQVFSNHFVLEYGLSERFCLGLIVPLIHASVEVNASSILNSKFKESTLGLSNADPRKAIRSSLQTSSSLSSINQLLRERFNYSDGLRSWSETGIGDIELGLKYNYLAELPLKASLKSGVRLPTGREDDPNQLFDLGFGSGQADLGFFNYVDYAPVSSIYFTWELGYTYRLPDSGDYRIPLSSDLPLGPAPIALDRKRGDFWESGFEGNFSPIKTLTLSAKYRFLQKFEDSFTGPQGVDTRLLEENSDQILHEGNFQIEYTNLPDVKAGRSHFPYGVIAFYRLPFSGENISDSRTTGLQLKTYF